MNCIIGQVSKEEWKEDQYPAYCSGSGFIMTAGVATALYNASFYVPFFWVDDVYITALLLRHVGTIEYRQFSSMYKPSQVSLDELYSGQHWNKYIFSQTKDDDQIQAVWSKLVRFARGLESTVNKMALPRQLQTTTTTTTTATRQVAFIPSISPINSSKSSSGST